MNTQTAETIRFSLPADDVEEVCGSINDLDADTLNSRRETLKSMLRTSMERYDRVMRRRLPSLAPGVRVRINNGSLRNRLAVVKEADYIAERALLDPVDAPPQWIRFSALGPA